MTIQVPLNHGLVALIDAVDADAVHRHTWWVVAQPHTSYAAREIHNAEGRRTTQRMHTFLTSWPQVDHINGNGLDNRRDNLRPATSSQNTHNRRKATGCRSRFKGIYLHPGGRWQARLRMGDRSKSLGYFVSEEDAARAYDLAAREAYGEFACLNFPLPGERSALEG